MNLGRISLEKWNQPISLKNQKKRIKFFPQEYYKYHPVIDFTSVGSHVKNIVPLDYFGFRNETDLYFVKYRTYKLVVITGGSEVAGYTHLTTIAQHLEEYLNSASKIKYKVINLGSLKCFKAFIAAVNSI